jgi:hypothetical protein
MEENWRLYSVFKWELQVLTRWFFMFLRRVIQACVSYDVSDKHAASNFAVTEIGPGAW